MRMGNAKGSRKDVRPLLQEDKIAARNWGCAKLCGGLVESAGEPKIRKIINRESKTQNRYLKPGAVAQVQDSRINSRPSCNPIGRKRVLLMGSATATSRRDVICVLSPTKMAPTARLSVVSASPKSPAVSSADEAHEPQESRLESLPSDLLVRIVCYLQHDQLKAMFHVSRKIRKAVLIAKRFHFNYITPDKGRCEFFRGGAAMQGVLTPKAPRQGLRPPARLSLGEMRQIAASLFQVSGRNPPGLPRSSYRSLGSHRALFCEDDLCQAIAHNTIR